MKLKKNLKFCFNLTKGVLNYYWQEQLFNYESDIKHVAKNNVKLKLALSIYYN